MKALSINELIKSGESKYSQVYLLSKNLNLKVLPVDKAGKVMFGSTTFAEIVDVITKKFQIKNILDLFSGSGALSKIVLLNGVRKVTCVDAFTDAMKTNLIGFKNKIKIIRGNILKTKFRDFYDIVLSDTPSILLLDFTKKILPKLNTHLIIMYYGGKGNIERDKKIEDSCKKLFKQTFIIQKYGLKHICCSSTNIGRKYIKFLQKKFS